MNKRKEFKKWLVRNGACNLDFKNRNIILYDGGLFSINVKKLKRHKIVGYKRFANGVSRVLFSRNKIIPTKEYEIILWFEELHDTINYLKRLERFLNKLGYKTDRSYLKH